MAIDFMIMPLSRYLSGDFVTPAMSFAWQQGVAYSVFGPDGDRDIAKGTPFGGADAASNRARFVPMILSDLTKLPASFRTNLWDEDSAAEPAFHRVDPRSYGSLLEQASPRAARPSLFGLLKRARKDPSHLSATVFLPITFVAPFDMPVVFERVAGSAQIALRELEAGSWNDLALSARDTLVAALHDAVRLGLPMIVDT